MATGSARSAITLALKAAKLQEGDEVIVSAYSCLAVPTGVIAAGGTPVYVDVDPVTLNADASAIAAAVTPRTRAVIVQHTLGKVAPVDGVRDALRGRRIVVIEDCALSLGSTSGGRAAGSMGDAAIFSMELSKTLTCGWGGLLVVHDASLATEARSIYETLPSPGFASETRDLWQTVISAWAHLPGVFPRLGKYVLHAGFTFGLFRRSTPAAELEGRVAGNFLEKIGGARARLAERQWRDLDRIARACIANAAALRSAIAEAGLPLVAAPDEGDMPVAPRVSFLVPDRAKAEAFFLEHGIELGSWFDGPMSPVPHSPRFNYSPGHYPNAERVAARVANLPCFSRLARRDLDHMIATLRAYATTLHPHPT